MPNFKYLRGGGILSINRRANAAGANRVRENNVEIIGSGISAIYAGILLPRGLTVSEVLFWRLRP